MKRDDNSLSEKSTSTFILNSNIEHTTVSKIKKFKFLKKNWHFNQGIEFDESIINLALRLHDKIIDNLFFTTDAFPGINGEIQVTFYNENDYLEFTIEGINNITFYHENNDIEKHYVENLTLDKAIDEIIKYRKAIWKSLGFSTLTTLIKEDLDLQVLPLKIPPKVESQFLKGSVPIYLPGVSVNI